MTLRLLPLALAWTVLLRVRSAPARAKRPVTPDPVREQTVERSPVAARRRPSGRGAVLVLAALALSVAAVAGPFVGAAVLAIPFGRRILRERRERRAADEAVAAAIPEVVDLLAIAVGAGLTLPLALEQVGRRSSGPLAEAMADVVRSAAQGQEITEALERARDRCGPGAVGLFSALLAATRHGTPLVDTLERLGDQARIDRRRVAEERARRVPVQLLFPLVVCVLPAFGLLTVVPLLVNSLGALQL